MTIFKTFWKILNKNKTIVIMYTIILLIFGVSNMQTSEKSMNFVANQPDVFIVNYDEEKGMTKNLIQYISEHSKVKEIENTEEKIKDALFYRDVNYVIYIPKNYHTDFLEGKNPELEIESVGDYGASFEEMILSRYIRVANIYQKTIQNENELIDKINETLAKEIEVKVTSNLDTNSLEKVAFYYNFASYSILACLLFIISLILSSFKEEKIAKRMMVSSTKDKKHNFILFLSNCCYSFLLWGLYVGISFALLGEIMATKIRNSIYHKFFGFNHLCYCYCFFYRKYRKE